MEMESKEMLHPESPMESLKHDTHNAKAVVAFPDAKDFETALRRVLKRGIPYDVLGHQTIITTIDYAKATFDDLPHTISFVMRSADLSPEDRATFRRKHYFPIS